MKTKTKVLFLFFLLSLLSGGSLVAQTKGGVTTLHITDGWYVGVKGGTLFGTSIFTSFGADKTRVGLSAGIFGGYRFNSILSMEAFLKAGQLNLAVRKNDVNANYWLGGDIVRYFAPVVDAEGWDYTNLTSRVGMQHFGLQGNVNLLGFFSSHACRLRLDISPMVSTIRTQADLVTINGNETVIKNDAQWHLGIGAGAQASYRISKHLELGLYGNVTHFGGTRFDRIPEHLYKAHLLYEGGVKLTWAFGKDVPMKIQNSFVAAVETPIAAPKQQEPVREEPKEPVIIAVEHPTEKAEPIIQEPVELSFSTIYFVFNRSTISTSEMPKMQEILHLLQNNFKTHVTITGWCDTVGSDSVNQRLSMRRAEAVKSWLTTQGISPTRIRTIGKGRDFNEKNAAKARRSETKETKENK